MPQNNLQILQERARKLCLKSSGTEQDLKRRLEQYYQRHGHLLPGKRECQKKRPIKRRSKRYHSPPLRQKKRYITTAVRRRKRSSSFRPTNRSPSFSSSSPKRCGPQCFADKEQKVPICPRCDSHRCHCYPDCDLMENAYKRGYNKLTLKKYAKHLNCKWIKKNIELPPHFDNVPKYDNEWIGKKFQAPDNKIHTIVSVSKEFIHTKTNTGENFKIPIKLFI